MPFIDANLLQRVYAAVDRLMEEEGQDRTMVIEMSQDMINDLIETGELKPMVKYIAHYCDVVDSREEAQEIADDI